MLEPAAALAALAAVARPGRRIGHRVEVHAALGSSSDRARQLLHDGDGEGTVVVADEQIAGRGRRGRTWTSPAGRNLTLSVPLRPRLAATDGWQLGLAVALAASDACAAVAPVAVKWPNDLVAGDGRKLGGLLVETAVDGAALTEAVIGIGINVNWRIAEMPPELAGSATSLEELAGTWVDRASLLARLLGALDEEIARVEAGVSPLERYRAACRTIGSEVVVDLGERRVQGRAVDVDGAGRLVLETAGGPMSVTSGEVVRTRPAVPA